MFDFNIVNDIKDFYNYCSSEAAHKDKRQPAEDKTRSCADHILRAFEAWAKKLSTPPSPLQVVSSFWKAKNVKLTTINNFFILLLAFRNHPFVFMVSAIYAAIYTPTRKTQNNAAPAPTDDHPSEQDPIPADGDSARLSTPSTEQTTSPATDVRPVDPSRQDSAEPAPIPATRPNAEEEHPERDIFSALAAQLEQSLAGEPPSPPPLAPTDWSEEFLVDQKDGSAPMAAAWVAEFTAQQPEGAASAGDPQPTPQRPVQHRAAARQDELPLDAELLARVKQSVVQEINRMPISKELKRSHWAKACRAMQQLVRWGGSRLTDKSPQEIEAQLLGIGLQSLYSARL